MKMIRVNKLDYIIYHRRMALANSERQYLPILKNYEFLSLVDSSHSAYLFEVIEKSNDQ